MLKIDEDGFSVIKERQCPCEVTLGGETISTERCFHFSSIYQKNRDNCAKKNCPHRVCLACILQGVLDADSFVDTDLGKGLCHWHSTNGLEARRSRDFKRVINFREEKISPVEKEEARLIKNKAMQKARLLQAEKAITDVGPDVKKIALKVGCSGSMAQQYLNFSHLDNKVKEAVRQEKISFYHALRLKVLTHKQQREMLLEILKKGFLETQSKILVMREKRKKEENQKKKTKSLAEIFAKKKQATQEFSRAIIFANKKQGYTYEEIGAYHGGRSDPWVSSHADLAKIKDEKFFELYHKRKITFGELRKISRTSDQERELKAILANKKSKKT